MKNPGIYRKKALLLSFIFCSVAGEASAINGTFAIGSWLGTRCIEVSNNNDNTPPQLRNFTNIPAKQWSITDLGNGYHSVINAGSGKALTRSGSGIVQLPYTGSNAQQWAINPVESELFKFINRESGQSFDLSGQNSSEGATIGLYGSNDGYNQRFFLCPAAKWGTANVNVPVGGNIQAALDQAARSGGGVVTLAPGTHVVPVQNIIKTHSFTRLQGTGVNATTVIPAGGEGITLFEAFPGANDYITLQDFTINGQNFNYNGIGIAGVTNLTLKNLKVLNMGGNGINSSGNNYFLVENVDIVSSGQVGYLHNVYCRRVSNMTFRNVRSINSVGGCGFKFSIGENWLFEDCIATGNVFDGIAMQDSNSNVVVRRCVFDNNGRGSNLGADDMTIEYCTFNHNNGYGIWTQGGNGVIRETTAFGNKSNNFEIHGGFSWKEAPLNNSIGSLNGRYEIRAGHSGKSLDVAGLSLADGGNVYQWSYVGANNQKWDLSNIAGNSFKVTSVNSGKALVAVDASAGKAANIEQTTYTGAANQQWTIANVGEGYYSFRAVNNGKSLDVVSNSQADGANIIPYSYRGGLNQKFRLIRR